MRTPAERAQTAAVLKEPDRVPVDIGATGLTGLRVEAQDQLLRHLKIDDASERRLDEPMRISEPRASLLERFPTDIACELSVARTENGGNEEDEERQVGWRVETDAETQAERAEDAWGVEWTREANAARFQPAGLPLEGELQDGWMESRDWPEPAQAETLKAPEDGDGLARLVGPFGYGLLETALLLRGRSDVNRDIALGTGPTFPLLEKIADLKAEYWERRLSEMETPPMFLMERERLDLLPGLPMEPKLFRAVLKPRWERLFQAVRRLSPSSFLLFFCRGYAVETVQDFIEAGVQAVCLDPLSVRYSKPSFLKREYGLSLAFWGGGVRSKNEFLKGTEEQAKDCVKEALDLFAPGGGFIWSLYPAADADVPPQNIEAALDAAYEYGLY